MTMPMPAPPAPGGYSSAPLPKRRNVVGVWLGLPLITLGIYNLVWYYKINEETRFSPRNEVNAVRSLLVYMFGGILIVPPFITVYHTGQRIAEAQRAAGLQPTCSGGIGILLCFFLNLWTLYYQSELNKIAESYPGAQAGQLVPLRAA